MEVIVLFTAFTMPDCDFSAFPAKKPVETVKVVRTPDCSGSGCDCGCEDGEPCDCKSESKVISTVQPTVTYYYPAISPATYQYYRPVRSYGITTGLVPRYQPTPVYRGNCGPGG